MNAHFSKHTSRQGWAEHCQAIQRFVNERPQRVMGITTVSRHGWFETAVFYANRPRPGPIDCKLQVSPHEQIFGHVAAQMVGLCNYICVDHTSWGEHHRCWAIWYYPEDVCVVSIPQTQTSVTQVVEQQAASAEVEVGNGWGKPPPLTPKLPVMPPAEGEQQATQPPPEFLGHLVPPDHPAIARFACQDQGAINP
eukprot:TRINITY_DN86937_c0_g1_i1.p1 TRINITY_DN86937_c0_g1~~TRINITY_DN86937_c0_g1_i1.p1  ORF type:complete len:195 (-),score=24.35 TRINITY_DN86937_c0_g1_i1:52-636(-)